MHAMIGQNIAHYRITAKLGEGGMGEVYRATDTKLNRDVAIKILPTAFADDADRMARFAREAQVLASLNHPNIASIYGVEERTLIMELVEGEMLAGPLPIETALNYAGQLIEALKAAHDKGIVHRDLKPANIKITPEGMVKVLDFGLAKAASDEASGDPGYSPTLSLAATRAGIILGTAGYMAPEQARGKAADTRADVWAFGVVLYEMLTGRRLFDGETISDTLAQVLTKEPDLNQVPEQARRLLRACLVRDPRRRLQSIGDAQLLLDEPAPSVIAAPVENRAKQWIPWLAAGVLAIAATAVGFVHFREQPPERRVLQYTIASPDKVKNLSHFAISPDGRYVVMRAGEGLPQLWVGEFDSLDVHPLAGTDGATYPFWSPDSRYIAFFADGKLKKISVNGGPAQAVCNVTLTGQGGTWNKDGVILFAAFNPGTSGIYSVSAGGGEPTQITKAESGAHRLPTFFPDGRRFVYVAAGEKDNGVILASLDSGTKQRRLILDLSGAQYLPPGESESNGHLLFVRDLTLMVQPMDPKTLEAKGDPFPVTASTIGTGQNPGDFSYSISSQGTLIYRTGGIVNESRLAWFDRSGKEVGVVGTAARIQAFALSPDGKRLAEARQRGNPGVTDLWVLESEQSSESRITFDESRNVYPVFSPDGKAFVFASTRAKTGAGNLYQKASDGTGQDQLLFESKELKVPTDWSRDGRFLIFRLTGTKTGDDLWALPMTGEKKPIELLNSPANEAQGRLSPDMKWLAYVSTESNKLEVYVQPFGPGWETPAAGKWQISIGGGAQPSWRGDGKELYYMAPDRRLMAVDIRSTPTTFDRGTPHPLFESRSDVQPTNPTNYGYAPSPDGKRFLILTRPGASADSPPLTVVVNWVAAAKK